MSGITQRQNGRATYSVPALAFFTSGTWEWSGCGGDNTLWVRQLLVRPPLPMTVSSCKASSTGQALVSSSANQAEAGYTHGDGCGTGSKGLRDHQLQFF